MANESWTSKPRVLDSITFLFDVIEQRLSERSRDIGLAPAIDAPSWNEGQYGSDLQQHLKQNLVDIGDYLLSAFEQRLVYLTK